MFKNISIDNSNDSILELDIPYNCAYYNGPMNIINGLEKSFNSSSKVKSSIFSDDQVLFSGDNVVMFSKNTAINSMRDFQNYVGANVVKTSWGKYISVYKKEPSSGTSNGESLRLPASSTFSVTEKLLFDFSSLGTDFSLLNDGTSDDSYTNQPFLGGIFTLDIGYVKSGFKLAFATLDILLNPLLLKP